MASGKCSKRGYNEISIAKKLEILQEVDKNERLKSEVARAFNIPFSTLSTWLKNRDKLEHVAESGAEIGKRKRLRTAKYEELEEILFQWFCNVRTKNIPLSGPLIKEKAAMLASRMGINDFKCSNGWLCRFQARHNIVSLNTCGKFASVNTNASESWLETVHPVLQEYAEHDIFNLDETGLFYNLMPWKTLSLKGETFHNGKHGKERITVLLCCNANGTEKFPPVIISKFANPNCMRQAVLREQLQLPCPYESNKNSWMTAKIFRDWLLRFQNKMTTQKRNVLLLMDQVSSHNIEGLNLPNVHVIFLPANTTSIIQPFDQGIISQLKAGYRKHLVRYMLGEISRGVPAEEIRKWNILDALRNVVASWQEIPAKSIRNCFAKVGFVKWHADADAENSQQNKEIEVPPEWEALMENINYVVNFRDYVNVDNDIATTYAINFDETIPNLDAATISTQMLDICSSDDDDNNEAPPRNPVSRKEIFAALSTIDLMLEDNAVSASEDIRLALEKLYAFAHKQYK
ncbi:tigger transposable element-derived protein 6-like [Centruroides vittatus]|uniref:tigger transposable element-derived protein 6-like n=1 Tax=Centruroides vittatus TaxID=120091 RepID=UPI00350F9859